MPKRSRTTMDTLTPPTQDLGFMAALPPMDSPFWAMTKRQQLIYCNAIDRARTDADRWMMQHAQEDWLPMAALETAGTGALIWDLGFTRACALLDVEAPFYVDGLMVEDARLALQWYDRAFRGRIDEALDTAAFEEEPTR